MPQPAVLLLSTSDTDLITARASGAEFRWANPSRLIDGELSGLLADADVVVVRILGGYRAWQDGIDAVVASGLPTVVVSGEQAPDADLMERSTVPAGIAVQTHIYLAQGGVENLRQLHAFLCRHPADDRLRLRPARAHPGLGSARADTRDTDGPTIAVLFYRAQQLAGNTAYIEALCAAIEDAGGRALPVYCTSLRTAEPELLDLLGTADAMVVTVLAAGGARPATATAGGDDDGWNVEHLAALDVPILQGLCLTSSRATVGRQRRRAEPARRRHPGGGARVRRPHHHRPVLVQGDRRRRADRLCAPTRSAARGWPAWRSTTRGCGGSPPPDKRVALVFSAYPTKHSRIGNAVGLDTPASAVALLTALRDDRLPHRRRFPAWTAG